MMVLLFCTKIIISQKKDLSKKLRQVLPSVGGPTTIGHTSEGTRQRPLSARDGDFTIDADHTAVNALPQMLSGTFQEGSLFEKKKIRVVADALFEARGLLRREELFGTAIFSAEQERSARRRRRGGRRGGRIWR